MPLSTHLQVDTTNVYQADKQLPAYIRCVVVLPLATEKRDPITYRVRGTLESILFLEVKNSILST